MPLTNFYHCKQIAAVQVLLEIVTAVPQNANILLSKSVSSMRLLRTATASEPAMIATAAVAPLSDQKKLDLINIIIKLTLKLSVQHRNQVRRFPPAFIHSSPSLKLNLFLIGSKASDRSHGGSLGVDTAPAIALRVSLHNTC